MSIYSSLSDLISFETSTTSGSNYSQGGRYVLAITSGGLPHFPEPKTLRLKNCVLKQALMQFPIGTKFDEIALNEHNVMYFYISDANKPHAISRSGYEYYGYWKTRLVFDYDGKKQEVDSKGNYFYRQETTVTKNGFLFEECCAKEDLGTLKKDEKFVCANFDIVNSAFTITTTNNGAFGGRLLVCFLLNVREISLEFLDKAFEEGMIDKTDCEQRKRNGYKVDMPNPLPNIDDDEPQKKKKIKSK